ncbi:MAG: integral membrane protein MviN, partial [uncultured bacterium]
LLNRSSDLVVMPHLSKNFASKDEKIFSDTLDWALKTVLLIGLPAAVGLFCLSGPILSTLIHYGKFNDFDVIMTSKSLKAFAVGVPAFMLIKILASAFYARQNIGTPVRVGAIALGVNLIFNFILIFPLKHAGLALATSLSSILNAALLWRLLIKCNIFHPRKIWFLAMVRLLIANFILGLFIYYLAGSITPWLMWSALERLWHLMYIIFLGGIVYIIVLYALGFRLRELKPE